MTLRRALGVAAADLYHQAWRLIILNTALGAGIVLVALASIAVRAALLLAILIGPAIAALMHCAVTLAQTEDLRLADALRGLRRHWRRGLALGLALAVAVALGALAVPFYAHAGTWAWPFAAVCIYLLLMFGVFQLALWPLVVFESDRPLRAVARDAALVLARRPFGFLGLAVTLLLVNVIGVAAAILPFLTLTIAYSFLVSAHFALPKNPAREA
ncbi:MAG: hypothetical protein E6G32_11150 [Actinobacteria bacterium]|nr:MAG: hypothetical protein E6G64_10430 [Actinomycetota bacterium]TML19964.1 MAG: hypothetical protein E6G32_11150 [Actinomycetota bacterium]